MYQKPRHSFFTFVPEESSRPKYARASCPEDYLLVEPNRALRVGFSTATMPLAAALVPDGWIRKSPMMTPTTTSPSSPRNDVGRINQPFFVGRGLKNACHAHVPASPAATPHKKLRFTMVPLSVCQLSSNTLYNAGETLHGSYSATHSPPSTTEGERLGMLLQPVSSWQ